jgi:hypothetical protein
MEIKGQITEVVPVIPVANATYPSLLITFRDGRIMKFRYPPQKFLQLSKKNKCVIECSDDGFIKNIKIIPKSDKKPNKKKRPQR